MRVDLGDDKVIDIEKLRQSSHWQVIVDRSVNPSLRRRVPGYCLPGFGVFRKDRCGGENKGNRTRRRPTASQHSSLAMEVGILTLQTR